MNLPAINFNEMKYGITKLKYTPDAFVEITEAQFLAAKTAKANLVTLVGIEEKFDLLMENYADYEREILNLTLGNVLFRDMSCQWFRGNSQVLTRRLANLLSAAKLYVDQVKHDLATAYGSESSMVQKIQEKFSAEYDGRIGYRAMDAIRNYIQHRSLPIHSVTYGRSRDESQGQVRLKFSVTPSIDIARLRGDEKFKSSVLSELEKTGLSVPITPLVREYVEGLAVAHESLRDMTTKDAKEWEALLADMQRRGYGQFGNEQWAVELVVVGADGKVTESHSVFEELASYRQMLVDKNANLKGLAARYVSGAAE
ncbi:MAG: hypothetical protein ACKOCD_00950 [Nitrospiraceae bacterium]